MAGRTKRAKHKPIEYTKYMYDPKKLGSRSVFDPECLEETSMGPVSEELIDYIEQEFPGSVGDSDADGYLEMDRYAVEVAAAELGLKGPFPLAALFVDDPPDTDEDVKPYTYDFNLIAEESDNPRHLSVRLSKYLSWIAVHAGLDAKAVIGLPDEVTFDQASGYSVDEQGRLRIDCTVFAKLAHGVLKTIPGLEFYDIDLFRKDGPIHRILFVTDGPGRNFLVDNDIAVHFGAKKPRRWISNTYRCSYYKAHIYPVGAKRGEELFWRNPHIKNVKGCGKRSRYVSRWKR